LAREINKKEAVLLKTESSFLAVLQYRGAVNPFLCNHHFPPTFYEKIIPYIYELTMIKGGKTIKYMVKNAKARKNLKKSEKNAKKT